MYWLCLQWKYMKLFISCVMLMLPHCASSWCCKAPRVTYFDSVSYGTTLSWCTELDAHVHRECRMSPWDKEVKHLPQSSQSTVQNMLYNVYELKFHCWEALLFFIESDIFLKSRRESLTYKVVSQVMVTEACKVVLWSFSVSSKK